MPRRSVSHVYRTNALKRAPERPRGIRLESLPGEHDGATWRITLEPFAGWQAALYVAFSLLGAATMCLLASEMLAALVPVAALCLTTWLRFLLRALPERLRFGDREHDARVMTRGPRWLRRWRVVMRDAAGRDVPLLTCRSRARAEYVAFVLREPASVALCESPPDGFALRSASSAVQSFCIVIALALPILALVPPPYET